MYSFTSFVMSVSTVFQLYQDGGRVIMKGFSVCLAWKFVDIITRNSAV